MCNLYNVDQPEGNSRADQGAGSAGQPAAVAVRLSRSARSRGSEYGRRSRDGDAHLGHAKPAGLPAGQTG